MSEEKKPKPNKTQWFEADSKQEFLKVHPYAIKTAFRADSIYSLAFHSLKCKYVLQSESRQREQKQFLKRSKPVLAVNHGHTLVEKVNN